MGGLFSAKQKVSTEAGQLQGGLRVWLAQKQTMVSQLDEANEQTDLYRMMVDMLKIANFSATQLAEARLVEHDGRLGFLARLRIVNLGAESKAGGWIINGRHVWPVDLHGGTVINPRSLTLRPGMVVTIHGHRERNGGFRADDINFHGWAGGRRY